MRKAALFPVSLLVSAHSLQAQQIRGDYIESRSRQLQSLIRGMTLRALITALTIVFVLMVAATQAAQAQTYKVIYNFTGGLDGGLPVAGLTMDAAGNLYGTAEFGGAAGQGTVFKLSHKGSGWVFTPLYSFEGGTDGAEPTARVVIGPDGSLYGTTNIGGGNGCYQGSGCGTVFNLRPPPRACTTALCPWMETVLYRFTGGSDGANPGIADLIFDQAGSLYGTTGSGGLAGCNGTSCGVVYELTPSNGGWTETVLYSFIGGNNGGNPGGGVTFHQGNLYGVADSGGSVGRGVAYELRPSGSGWTENVLYDFDSGASGVTPVGTPVFDTAGNIYFPTAIDTLQSSGTVYELSKSNNTWTLTRLVTLSHQFVSGGLVMDASGNLYDTSTGDGRNTWGSVFEVTPNQEIVLHWFSSDCGDGCEPEGGVLPDANGNLYGTASGGGQYGYGVVWEITP